MPDGRPDVGPVEVPEAFFDAREFRWRPVLVLSRHKVLVGAFAAQQARELVIQPGASVLGDRVSVDAAEPAPLLDGVGDVGAGSIGGDDRPQSGLWIPCVEGLPRVHRLIAPVHRHHPHRSALLVEPWHGTELLAVVGGAPQQHRRVGTAPDRHRSRDDVRIRAEWRYVEIHAHVRVPFSVLLVALPTCAPPPAPA